MNEPAVIGNSKLKTDMTSPRLQLRRIPVASIELTPAVPDPPGGHDWLPERRPCQPQNYVGTVFKSAEARCRRIVYGKA
jgi:hypothetical protein